MLRFLRILYRDLWTQFLLVLIFVPFLGLIVGEKELIPLNAACVISLIITVLVAKYLYVRLFNAVYLARNGIEVKAIVKNEDLEFRGASDIYFEFLYDGKKYRSFGSYTYVSPGSKIKLLIDPENPDIHMRI